MDIITLTHADLPVANPARLSEELEAALGVALQVLVRQTGGQVTEALVKRADGLSLTVEDETLIRSVAETHDPGLLSTEQADEEARDLRRTEARDRLVGIGADGVRATGLPDLADVVADIVEALELDL